MDSSSFFFGMLFLIVVLCILGMNFAILRPTQTKEGFVDPAQGPSQIEARIRKILDPMTFPQVCPLFDTIRSTMLKNELAGNKISEEEAMTRVEKELAVQIPGGALPCPLLTYPRPGSGDLEWLSFLTGVPVDYGARVIFMAIYADTFLSKTKADLESSLGGGSGKPEGFATICPPDIAASRRSEKAKKDLDNCILPEDMSPADILNQVDSLLVKLVSTRNKQLLAKGYPLDINIGPYLTRANAAVAYLKDKQAKAESGDLRPTPPPIE